MMELRDIAEMFFQVQKNHQEGLQKKKENQLKQKEKLIEAENNYGLVPKPASLSNVLLKTPNDNIEYESDKVSDENINKVTSDLPPKKRNIIDVDSGDFGQKVNSEPSEICPNSKVSPRKIDFGQESIPISTKKPSFVSKKKAKPNRHVQVIDFFDGKTDELDSILKNLSTVITSSLECPPENDTIKIDTKIDELQKLLDIKQKLKDQGIDSNAITKKIEKLLKEIDN